MDRQTRCWRLGHCLRVLALAVCMFRAPAVAESRPTGSLNVKDFGAKGDGTSDDSDAIQRALLAASSPGGARFMYWAWTAAPEVYFPEGTYVVSRTLLVPACGGEKGVSNHINLRGENATIKQLDPDQDILYFRMAHRNLIEGLTFEDGRRQLKIWSRNTDQARVMIRDCTFRNSSSCAIDDQLRLDPKAEPRDWYRNVLEPYTIELREDGLPMLTPLDESLYPVCLFVSTGMRISRCAFEQCMQVLSVWADLALMDQCTIETHPEMNGPAIRCGAALMLEDVTGLARVTPGRPQWWITLDPRKHYSGVASLNLRNVRLRTDSEAGLCIVRNEAKWTGGVHVSIIADGCEFQSAGSAEDSAIHLVEAPNIINVRNCRETSGKPANLLGFGKPFGKDYFYPADTWKILGFIVDDHNENLVANLPEAMQPFAEPPLPETVARRFDVRPRTIVQPGLREDVQSRLRVMDYGAAGTGRRDDSGAFRRALAEASSRPGLAEVTVPAGVYRLDSPVELPPRVVLRGVGQAALTVPSGRAGAVLTAPRAEHIAVQNLHFFNCEQALEISTVPEARSDILVDNCRFHRNRRWAITCLSGTGAATELNKTTLRVSDCTFSLSPVLLQNAQYALVENVWVTTDPATPDHGVFVNKGLLHLHTLLGVPRTTERDMRWVDNYGRVLLDHCRFGGEGGGLPMVVNFADKGEVLIQDSWLFCRSGNPKRVTIVDCEEIPQLIALRRNWGWPPPKGPQMMVTVRKGAHGELTGRFFESCNTVWRVVRDERAH